MKEWKPDPLVRSLCDYGDETCALGYCCQYYGAALALAALRRDPIRTWPDPPPGPTNPTPPHPSPRN